MNQTFSVNRFGRLLRMYFIDNRGQLLANIGLLVGGLFVLTVFAYQGIPSGVDNQRYVLFFLLGWPCWYVFTLQQTAVLNQKERAINYLMQPASQLEKILLIWLVSGVCFVIVYVSAFGIFDAIGVSYVNNRDWSPKELNMIKMVGSSLEIQSIFSDKAKNMPSQMWVLTVLLHPFTMAFSLLIRRYTLPVVVVIAFGLIIFGYISNNSLLHTLIGSDVVNSVSPFMQGTATSPTNRYDYRSIDLPQPIGDQIRYVVGSLVVVLLYVMAYFRLKEREV